VGGPKAAHLVSVHDDARQGTAGGTKEDPQAANTRELRPTPQRRRQRTDR